MSNLLKIVVVDSGGQEHIFNESSGEEEHYLDLKDENGFVTITTRVFSVKKTYDCETQSTFISPRRVDVLFGEYL